MTVYWKNKPVAVDQLPDTVLPVTSTGHAQGSSEQNKSRPRYQTKRPTAMWGRPILFS